MFGLQLQREHWVLLAVLVYVLVRVAFAFGQVLGRLVLDGPVPGAMSVGFSLASGLAGAVAVCCAVSLWVPVPRMVRLAVLYPGAVVGGGLVGILVDVMFGALVIRLSVWFSSFRLPQYRDRLASDDPAVRLTAAKRMFELGQYAAPAAPDLTAAARDESADVRGFALLALLGSLVEDDGVMEAARGRLADPDPRVRAAAGMVLARVRKAPLADVLPPLGDGLMLLDEPFATCSLNAINDLGEDAAPAAGALRAAIFVREPPLPNAVVVLGQLGEAGVPVLIEVLRRGTNLDKQSAARALADMGEKARPALPALRDAAASQDIGVKSTADLALQKLGASKK